MNGELISLISVNRDAIATNRGFYYQYLNVALKWISNYAGNHTADIYTEVDDDIKEVGDKLVFTQLKCYSSSFSFNSTEIKKALLNFYSLYLQNHEAQHELQFCFTTNAAIGRNEKLLQRWVNEQPLQSETLSLCKTKISGLLLKEIKQIRDSRLTKGKFSLEAKRGLTEKFEELNRLVVAEPGLTNFISAIRWAFEEETPEQAIKNLAARITEGLYNPIFGDRPIKMLFEAILSEIYRRSQLTDQEERKVTYSGMKALIEANDEQLNTFIDKRLVSLFSLRLDLLENSLNDVKEIITGVVNVQQEHGELINKLISQGSSHQIPKQITRIPFQDTGAVCGRDDKLTEIQAILSEARHVTIIGNGGMGKSTLLKYFLSKFESGYDHVIWLNAESGLVNSISINAEIADALQLPIEQEKFAERFELILSRLKLISGNNLLVIDGYIEAVPQLAEFRALSNWQTLVGTRLRIPGWRSVSVDGLPFDDAKKLYFQIDTINQVPDEELEDFFEEVEFNTLTIALVAKTIINSFDLNLAKVMEHFQAQDLDDVSMQIDITGEDGTSARLLNILKATFALTSLDDYSRYFLLYFSLLPTEDIEIVDLVDWFGKRLKAQNKTQITNAINQLHSKGLVERNGRTFNLHRMLQQTILYTERQTANPFITQVMLIGDITSRLHEGADHDINKALRFLKFGEAILDNIKEPYRRSIYQPMLLLENEVLNIYNWLYTDNDLSIRYESLYNRAKNSIGTSQALTGVIANNYGLALAAEGNLEASIPLFDEATVILEAHPEKALPQMITSLCNLCHLFIRRGEMERFSECFNKMQEIRQKNNLWEDVSLPIQASVLGIANKTYGNYAKALEMFNMAINIHLELPAEKRNDMQLVGYVLNAAECYMMTKELEKAEKAVIYATNILHKNNAKDTIYLGETIKYLIAICEIKGEHSQAEQLKGTLRNMGFREEN